MSNTSSQQGDTHAKTPSIAHHHTPSTYPTSLINRARISLASAFPHTLSICVGYVLMGAVFGILLAQAGFSYVWALFMGLCIYAGAMQFACITLLANGASIAESMLLAVMINARQIFYAIPCLSLFSPYPKRKWYLAFALTDESFALMHLKAHIAHERKIDMGDFLCAIAFLHHVYWIIGCVLGGVLGGIIRFDMQGMGFVMNAIFIVLCIDQWKSSDKHAWKASLLGIGLSVLCLSVFGASVFLIPTLVLLCICAFLYDRYGISSNAPYQKRP